MAELPSEIMYNILSRMPVKSLARCRCVSNQWCNYINDPYLETMHAKRAAVHDPMLIMLHQFSSDEPNSPCILTFPECKEEAGEGSCTLEVRKKPAALEFMRESCKDRNPWFIVLGSCNGLLYSAQRLGCVACTLVVIHPLKGECYELPPYLMPPFDSGLGFDDSTNTFKMVCLEQKEKVFESPPNYTMVQMVSCPKVHVLGTDSWREMPQYLFYEIRGDGVFANGCLHWLTGYCDFGNCGIVRFDMKTEEFGLIKPPRERHPGIGMSYECLVDLHGQLGFVYVLGRSVELWVLKEGAWVMHCEFEQKPPLSGSGVKVLGFWNENGDILITDKIKDQRWFVYKLKSDSLREVSAIGWEEGCVKDFLVYQSSLFSTRYSIKNPRNVGLIELFTGLGLAGQQVAGHGKNRSRGKRVILGCFGNGKGWKSR